MKVGFKLLNENARFPAYGREGDACLDISSSENTIIKPKSFQIVSTGLAVEIPAGFELQIRARSGLAAKKGIGLVNGIGTIDENYRGELKIVLFNLGEEDFIVEVGDRIAQICFFETTKIEPQEIVELSQTNRNDNGLGSSGIKFNEK